MKEACNQRLKKRLAHQTCWSVIFANWNLLFQIVSLPPCQWSLSLACSILLYSRETLHRWACAACCQDTVSNPGLIAVINRELKHQTVLVPRTPTGSIFAARQPLRMWRLSRAAVTGFETRVLRLKPEVQIRCSSKSIRHSKVEILRLKSCFLRNKT